jgi:hypothetical protein
MSSARNTRLHSFHAASAVAALLLAIALVLAVGSGQVDAKKSKTSATNSKLPSITAVAPLSAFIGTTLTITGKNFVKGKNQDVFIFQRKGSKRKFAVRANGLSTKTATLLVPNVSADLIPPVKDHPFLPTDNQYHIRVVTKYGASKSITSPTISPVIALTPGGPTADQKAPDADCDSDGIINSADPDDDNDLMSDVDETANATDPCNTDTDGDLVSDYYEWRVAYERNGGPTLPYPALRPYPNPLVADSSLDYDQDYMREIDEFQAWQFTGHMDRFYSDASQDSDGDGVVDGAEDEDGDLLPNLVELQSFGGWALGTALNFVKTDTDGDGLCDGLDDEDHDGAPTALADADCSTPVPNNGNVSTPNSPVGAGDPGPLIDGDDNRYSNYYEWVTNQPAGNWYDPCAPSIWPFSPTCHAPLVFY